MIEKKTRCILDEVYKEREAQFKVWGRQNLPPIEFLAILAEEFGEVAREVAESITTHTVSDNYRYELIQLAAVAVQAIEVWDEWRQ